MREEIIRLESQLIELVQKYGLNATPDEQREIIKLGEELEAKRAQLTGLKA
jgi:hypothetical protein